MTNETLFHTIREQYEQETEYFMTLQELGTLTEDNYFNSSEHEDCSIWVGNDCNAFIEPPSKFVGYAHGYDI